MEWLLLIPLALLALYALGQDIGSDDPWPRERSS